MCERFPYPDNHIESDNRLAWALGLLEHHYGDNAVYVHLKRNEMAVANSYASRFFTEESIMFGYRQSILLGNIQQHSRDSIALDLVKTINFNIEQFLANKSLVATIDIEDPAVGFLQLWSLAGFKGDQEAALRALETRHNKRPTNSLRHRSGSLFRRFKRMVQRIPDLARRR